MTELTAARLRELLDYDPETGRLTWRVKRRGVRAAGMVAGNWSSSTGYCQIMIDKQNYTAHRLAWLWMTGAWPVADIDHINMDRTDTRWCNLREATQTQNRGNASLRADNTSGFRGVSWHKRLGWEASIVIRGRKTHLGWFAARHQAYATYCIAARKHFCGYARLYDDDIMIEPGPRSIGNDWLGI